MSPIPLITRAEGFADRTAIIAVEGTFTYAQLLADSAAVASCLLDGAADLAEARVAFLTPPGYHYVATQWGVWRAGGVTVPLATSHPKPELRLHDRRLRRDHSHRPPVLRGDAAPPRRGAWSALPPDPRHPGDEPHSPAAGRRPRASRHDHLHQRHHQPAQGRRVPAHHHPGADDQPRGSLGLVRRRPHPACAAAPPHPRHRQRARLRPLVPAPSARCSPPSTPTPSGTASSAAASACSWPSPPSTAGSCSRGTPRRRSAG